MIVDLRNVSKTFAGRTAVAGIDLQVPTGSCFGLLGPNGAGKTTTLRMIYGVTRPSGGAVLVFGRDLAREARAIRARLGVTLQDNVFIEALSPVENLRVFGRYHLMREPELSRRVDELVDFLELRSHADVPVRALSGGFQRRLAIAMSLVNRPELLILDEPTTGLDPAVRLALWGRIRELRAAGTTVLLTTHYMDEAERLCDRIAVMAAGRIVDVGSPAELIRRHVAPVAVEFDCSSTEQAALLAATGNPKHLRAGNRLLIYVAAAEPVLAHLGHDAAQRRSLIVRPANLEDVFLDLTGTTLEQA